FQVIHNRFKGRALQEAKAALEMNAVRKNNEAHDVAQAAFIKLFIALDRALYDPRRDFWPYFRQIIRHVAWTRGGRGGREQNWPDDMDPADAQPSAEAVASTRDQVENMLDQLTPLEEKIMRGFAAGHTGREIDQMLNLAKGTAHRKKYDVQGR